MCRDKEREGKRPVLKDQARNGDRDKHTQREREREKMCE